MIDASDLPVEIVSSLHRYIISNLIICDFTQSGPGLGKCLCSKDEKKNR